MLKTEAIQQFLIKNTHEDLAALYNYNMEVQVNVGKDGGDRIQGEYQGKRWTGYTDGITEWKPFRIPYNANTKPEYNDTELRFDFDKHVEGVGMTGWDWSNLISRWVAFDFDAIVGHSVNHTQKLTESELREVQDAVNSIPWTTVRHSTSGSGLHIYVMLDGTLRTETHTEHAALARSILGLMSAMTGRDLIGKVDACGQNMWVWHRKMKGTKGLSLIKQGEVFTDIPKNWKEHIPVISGKRARTLPAWIETTEDNKSEEEILFEQLSGQRANTQLDDEHRKLINYLSQETRWHFDFNPDHHMLTTHTNALKSAFEALKLKGIFETATSESSTHNCFAFPLRGGAWVIRRFTRGVQEHPTWHIDRTGYTRCYLNRQPDLKTVAAYFAAIEHSSGGFVFKDGDLAIKAAEILGAKIDIAEGMRARPIRLRLNKDERLVIEFDAMEQDPQDKMQGWLKQKRKWTKVSDIKSPPKHEAEIGNYDDIIRHLVDAEGNDCGWAVCTDGKNWRLEPLTHVKLLLASFNIEDSEIKKIQGISVAKCWQLVNLPFQPEYPGNRTWNRSAPQFLVPPSTDIDNLNYPTWTKLLTHCGAGLDEAIKENAWCLSNNILTGADYLKCWLASIIHKPTEPLPYLFFYSKEQNTGKSSFHEALRFLFTKGYVRADHALSDQNFNGELENAIICVIEEKDLNDSKGDKVYNKIKDWVTSKLLSIRKMYHTPYTVTNTTHWIHCSNNQAAVPLFPGDSRIVMLHVRPLPQDQLIPKRDLERLLQKEAADFLGALVNLELPEPPDRLALPIIMTFDKEGIMETNLNEFEGFINDFCHYAPGHFVRFEDLYDRFVLTLTPESVKYWTKQRVSRSIDINKYPRGQTNEPGRVIGNISFTPVDISKCHSIYVAGPNNSFYLRKIDEVIK